MSMETTRGGPASAGRRLRIGIAQMQPRLADLSTNLDKLEEFVERGEASEAGIPSHDLRTMACDNPASLLDL